MLIEVNWKYVEKNWSMTGNSLSCAFAVWWFNQRSLAWKRKLAYFWNRCEEWGGLCAVAVVQERHRGASEELAVSCAHSPARSAAMWTQSTVFCQIVCSANRNNVGRGEERSVLHSQLHAVRDSLSCLMGKLQWFIPYSVTLPLNSTHELIINFVVTVSLRVNVVNHLSAMYFRVR